MSTIKKEKEESKGGFSKMKIKKEEDDTEEVEIDSESLSAIEREELEFRKVSVIHKYHVFSNKK